RRSPNKRLPKEPMIAILRRKKVDGRYVRNVLKRHRLDIPLPHQVKTNIKGTFYVKHGDLRLSFDADGAYEIEYAHPNLNNRHSLEEKNAVRIAESFIQEEGLSKNIDLVFDCIRFSKLSGGQPVKKGFEGPFTSETTVEFTQIVNDIPVISPKYGRIRVSIDNDGNITRLQNHTREILGLTKHSKGYYPGPKMNIQMHELDVYRRLLEQQWQKRLLIRNAMGKKPSIMELLPGSDEIGYVVIGNEMA
ncbi:unnamed protein product, partial [marine sediment metagenome]